MRRIFSHRTIDSANEAADRLIARRLRTEPRLLRAARRNLAQWMARDGKDVRPVWLEWSLILEKLTREEIAGFLESNTPKARRLRQSTPFMGLLRKSEAAAIARKYYADKRD